MFGYISRQPSNVLVITAACNVVPVPVRVCYHCYGIFSRKSSICFCFGPNCTFYLGKTPKLQIPHIFFSENCAIKHKVLWLLFAFWWPLIFWCHPSLLYSIFRHSGNFRTRLLSNGTDRTLNLAVHKRTVDAIHVLVRSKPHCSRSNTRCIPLYTHKRSI